MRTLVILVLAVCIVAFVGCHPKKVRPLDEEEGQQVTPRQERQPRPGFEDEGREPAIKPLEQDVTEEIGFETVHFDYDKYNLTDQAAAALSRNAEILMEHPDIDIVVEGHCDERGTDEYNLALGEKRAITARDFLVRFGIAKSRLSIISFGEERPKDPAHNEEAWAKNRRAEFVKR